METLTGADVIAEVARQLRHALGPVRIFLLREDPYEPETMGPGPVLIVVTDRKDVSAITNSIEADEIPWTYPVTEEEFASGRTQAARAAQEVGVEI